MSQYIGSSDAERKSLADRRRGGERNIPNEEIMAAFAIDPHYDPYSIPLEQMDPSHPSLFLHGTQWPHFERLRAEAPVHYHEDSMFGPYWSVVSTGGTSDDPPESPPHRPPR